MSKKSRRARARARAKAKYRAVEMAASVPAVPVYRPEPKLEIKQAMPSAERGLTRAQVIRYDYIVPELRRISIVAGALFIILIILTFVLH